MKDYISLKIIECNTKSLQELENLFTMISAAFGGDQKKNGENASPTEIGATVRSLKELK